MRLNRTAMAALTAFSISVASFSFSSVSGAASNRSMLLMGSWGGCATGGAGGGGAGCGSKGMGWGTLGCGAGSAGGAELWPVHRHFHN